MSTTNENKPTASSEASDGSGSSLALGSASSGCRCQSYNRPDWGGDQAEMIVPKPEWSDRQNDTICLDACISDAILMLWENGVQTLGCCCGHNRMPPNVVIAESADGQRAIELLRKNDGRQWEVMQWQLVTILPNNLL